ncbi:stationary-phase-induced ribosome-associated protein [Serratia liquefaciens]|uniref:stationary-phase-induced ribosome-associated protein n=1 Tax=Serratia liquefaciens TaxID=614 RepID=UPI00165D0959|nr:stationary-phase-induced ribosome-associated protein [Serratia liquefaciens]QNQ52336.1 stationary-phase-induced ribosome-associated protein [Serratia liquefaciens]
MAKRKSNRQARHVMGMPHWLSNTQFQGKCKHSGNWVVTQTRSWSVPDGFYLSRQWIAFVNVVRRAEAQEKAL